MSNEVATQTLGPELDPQNPLKKSGMSEHTYNASAGEAEPADPGGSLACLVS